jgi:hypothetical protein
MDAKRQRDLLKQLPKAARDAVLMLDAKPRSARARIASIAFKAVAFPPSTEDGVALVDDLTPAQRALAELVAVRTDELYTGDWAMPSDLATAVRWLGLEPGGVLEREVAFADGKRKRVPLWRALMVLGSKDVRAMHAFIRSLKLSVVERLDLFVQRSLGYFHMEDVEPVPDAEIGSDAGEWATREADRLLALTAARGRGAPDVVTPAVATVLLLAIVRAGRAVEPRWDVFIKPPLPLTPAALEILRAIPEPRRGTALARLFTRDFDKYPLAAGLALLAPFPSRPLTQAILGLAEDGIFTKKEILAKLAPIAKKHAVVRDQVDAFQGKQRKEPPPLVLTTTSEKAPRTLAELTKLQRLQLTAMIGVYDGDKRSLEKRFGKEEALGGMALRIRVIVDAKRKPVYEAFSWLADDGCVFEKGTTNMVAHLIQHSVDQCDDPRLEEALETALGPAKRAKRTSRK